jgi:hypothetical protein
VVTKTLERADVLTVDEVKQALFDFLKMKLDQPVPPTPKELTFKWNGPGEAFITFTERHQVP